MTRSRSFDADSVASGITLAVRYSNVDPRWYIAYGGPTNVLTCDLSPTNEFEQYQHSCSKSWLWESHCNGRRAWLEWNVLWVVQLLTVQREGEDTLSLLSKWNHRRLLVGQRPINGRKMESFMLQIDTVASRSGAAATLFSSSFTLAKSELRSRNFTAPTSRHRKHASAPFYRYSLQLKPCLTSPPPPSFSSFLPVSPSTFFAMIYIHDPFRASPRVSPPVPPHRARALGFWILLHHLATGRLLDEKKRS